MVREAQIRAAGHLAAEALGAMARAVGDVHRAVAHRVAAALLPPPAAEVATMYAGIAELVYRGVDGAVRIAPLAATEILLRSRHGEGPALTETTAGRHVVAAVNGLWGDSIAARHPVLAVRASLRHGGADLRLDRASLAEAFPEPTARIAVFIHGLTENDRSWWKGWAGAEQNPTDSFGDLLHRDLGYTPMYFHYNSGLRVSENGRALANTLEELVAGWPVPVEELALVGHSMGGLLARSACYQGEQSDQAWVSAVRCVVTLGTPHLGAPLEKAVHLARRLLAVAPESEPLGRLLGGRSDGVRDMRFGALVEADRNGHVDLLADPCTDVPLLSVARYHYVTASILPGRHPASRVLGDGLVLPASAAGVGRHRQVPFEPGDGVHLTGLHHFSLLHDADVYTHLRGWLDPDL